MSCALIEYGKDNLDDFISERWGSVAAAHYGSRRPFEWTYAEPTLFWQKETDDVVDEPRSVEHQNILRVLHSFDEFGVEAQSGSIRNVALRYFFVDQLLQTDVVEANGEHPRFESARGVLHRMSRQRLEDFREAYCHRQGADTSHRQGAGASAVCKRDISLVIFVALQVHRQLSARCGPGFSGVSYAFNPQRQDESAERAEVSSVHNVSVPNTLAEFERWLFERDVMDMVPKFLEYAIRVCEFMVPTHIWCLGPIPQPRLWGFHFSVRTIEMLYHSRLSTNGLKREGDQLAEELERLGASRAGGIPRPCSHEDEWCLAHMTHMLLWSLYNNDRRLLSIATTHEKLLSQLTRCYRFLNSRKNQTGKVTVDSCKTVEYVVNILRHVHQCRGCGCAKTHSPDQDPCRNPGSHDWARQVAVLDRKELSKDAIEKSLRQWPPVHIVLLFDTQKADTWLDGTDDSMVCSMLLAADTARQQEYRASEGYDRILQIVVDAVFLVALEIWNCHSNADKPGRYLPEKPHRDRNEILIPFHAKVIECILCWDGDTSMMDVGLRLRGWYATDPPRRPSLVRTLRYSEAGDQTSHQDLQLLNFLRTELQLAAKTHRHTPAVVLRGYFEDSKATMHEFLAKITAQVGASAASATIEDLEFEVFVDNELCRRCSHIPVMSFRGESRDNNAAPEGVPFHRMGILTSGINLREGRVREEATMLFEAYRQESAINSKVVESTVATYSVGLQISPEMRETAFSKLNKGVQDVWERSFAAVPDLKKLLGHGVTALAVSNAELPKAISALADAQILTQRVQLDNQSFSMKLYELKKLASYAQVTIVELDVKGYLTREQAKSLMEVAENSSLRYLVLAGMTTLHLFASNSRALRSRRAKEEFRSHSVGRHEDDVDIADMTTELSRRCCDPKAVKGILSDASLRAAKSMTALAHRYWEAVDFVLGDPNQPAETQQRMKQHFADVSLILPWRIGLSAPRVIIVVANKDCEDVSLRLRSGREETVIVKNFGAAGGQREFIINFLNDITHANMCLVLVVETSEPFVRLVTTDSGMLVQPVVLEALVTRESSWFEQAFEVAEAATSVPIAVVQVLQRIPAPGLVMPFRFFVRYVALCEWVDQRARFSLFWHFAIAKNRGTLALYAAFDKIMLHIDNINTNFFADCLSEDTPKSSARFVCARHGGPITEAEAVEVSIRDNQTVSLQSMARFVAELPSERHLANVIASYNFPLRVFASSPLHVLGLLQSLPLREHSSSALPSAAIAWALALGLRCADDSVIKELRSSTAADSVAFFSVAKWLLLRLGFNEAPITLTNSDIRVLNELGVSIDPLECKRSTTSVVQLLEVLISIESIGASADYCGEQPQVAAYLMSPNGISKEVVICLWRKTTRFASGFLTVLLAADLPAESPMIAEFHGLSALRTWFYKSCDDSRLTPSNALLERLTDGAMAHLLHMLSSSGSACTTAKLITLLRVITMCKRVHGVFSSLFGEEPETTLFLMALAHRNTAEFGGLLETQVGEVVSQDFVTACRNLFPGVFYAEQESAPLVGTRRVIDHKEIVFRLHPFDDDHLDGKLAAQGLASSVLDHYTGSWELDKSRHFREMVAFLGSRVMASSRAFLFEALRDGSWRWGSDTATRYLKAALWLHLPLAPPPVTLCDRGQLCQLRDFLQSDDAVAQVFVEAVSLNFERSSEMALALCGFYEYVDQSLIDSLNNDLERRLPSSCYWLSTQQDRIWEPMFVHAPLRCLTEAQRQRLLPLQSGGTSAVCQGYHVCEVRAYCVSDGVSADGVAANLTYLAAPERDHLSCVVVLMWFRCLGVLPSDVPKLLCRCSQQDPHRHNIAELLKSTDSRSVHAVPSGKALPRQLVTKIVRPVQHCLFDCRDAGSLVATYEVLTKSLQTLAARSSQLMTDWPVLDRKADTIATLCSFGAATGELVAKIVLRAYANGNGAAAVDRFLLSTAATLTPIALFRSRLHDRSDNEHTASSFVGSMITAITTRCVNLLVGEFVSDWLLSLDLSADYAPCFVDKVCELGVHVRPSVANEVAHHTQALAILPYGTLQGTALRVPDGLPRLDVNSVGRCSFAEGLPSNAMATTPTLRPRGVDSIKDATDSQKPPTPPQEESAVDEDTSRSNADGHAWLTGRSIDVTRIVHLDLKPLFGRLSVTPGGRCHLVSRPPSGYAKSSEHATDTAAALRTTVLAASWVLEMTSTPGNDVVHASFKSHGEAWDFVQSITGPATLVGKGFFLYRAKNSGSTWKLYFGCMGNQSAHVAASENSEKYSFHIWQVLAYRSALCLGLPQSVVNLLEVGCRIVYEALRSMTIKMREEPHAVQKASLTRMSDVLKALVLNQWSMNNTDNEPSAEVEELDPLERTRRANETTSNHVEKLVARFIARVLEKMLSHNERGFVIDATQQIREKQLLGISFEAELLALAEFETIDEGDKELWKCVVLSVVQNQRRALLQCLRYMTNEDAIRLALDCFHDDKRQPHPQLTHLRRVFCDVTCSREAWSVVREWSFKAICVRAELLRSLCPTSGGMDWKEMLIKRFLQWRTLMRDTHLRGGAQPVMGEGVARRVVGDIELCHANAYWSACIPRLLWAERRGRFDVSRGATLAHCFDAFFKLPLPEELKKGLARPAENAIAYATGEDLHVMQSQNERWLSAVFESPLCLERQENMLEHIIFKSFKNLGHSGSVIEAALAQLCDNASLRRTLLGSFSRRMPVFCERRDRHYGVVCMPHPSFSSDEWKGIALQKIFIDDAADEEVYRNIINAFSIHTTHVVVDNAEKVSDRLLKWCCEYTFRMPWRYIVLVNCDTSANFPENRDRITNLMPPCVSHDDDTPDTKTLLDSDRMVFEERVRSMISPVDAFASKVKLSWSEELETALTTGNQCVIHLVSPPGAGKTSLLRQLQYRLENTEVQRPTKFIFFDCSDDRLVEEALVALLDARLSDLQRGRDAIVLVADEYHMLTARKKSEFVSWISDKLDDVKVVMIANRIDAHDTKELHQGFTRSLRWEVDDLYWRARISAEKVAQAAEPFAFSPTDTQKVIAFFGMLRTLIGDDAVSLRLIEFAFQCAGRYGSGGGPPTAMDKALTFKLHTVHPRFIATLLDAFDAGFQQLQDQLTSGSADCARVVESCNAASDPLQVLVLIALLPSMLDMSRDPKCADSFLTFKEFCECSVACRVHPRLRFARWSWCTAKRINSTYNTTLNEERDWYESLMCRLEVLDASFFPQIMGTIAAPSKEFNSVGIVVKEHHADLEWVANALVRQHTISWKVMTRLWELQPVDDLPALLNVLTFGQPVEVLGSMNASNVNALVWRELRCVGRESNNALLTKHVLSHYPDIRAQTDRGNGAPFFTAVWASAVWVVSSGATIQDAEEHVLGILVRLAWGWSYEGRECSEYVFDFLRYVSQNGRQIALMCGDVNKMEPLADLCLQLLTSVTQHCGSNERGRRWFSVWSGRFLAPYASVRSNRGGCRIPLHDAILLATFRPGYLNAHWPREIKIFQKCGSQGGTPVTAARLLQPQLFSVEDTTYLMETIDVLGLSPPAPPSRLVGAMLQTVPAGFLPSSIQRRLLEINVAVNEEDFLHPEATDLISRNLKASFCDATCRLQGAARRLLERAQNE